MNRTLGFIHVRLPDQDAWFGAAVASVFNALGTLLDASLARKIPGISITPLLLSSCAGFILTGVLFAWRKTPSLKWASIIYAINTAFVLNGLLSTDLQFAVSEKHWVPFQATKLGCLVAAMIAPGFWVGLAAVLAYTVGAFLQFEYFFPPHLKAQIAAGEPIPILAFGLAGVIGLIYRFRRAQVEQELARIQAQNFAIKRLTQAFLDVRDRMNTPLQVIELSIDLIRNSNQPPQPFLDHIEHSLQRLRQINSVLVQHEKQIEWQTKQ